MLEILELRRITGLSQSKFAKKYHIGLSTLQKWEHEINKPTEYYLFALNELMKYQGYFYDNENRRQI